MTTINSRPLFRHCAAGVYHSRQDCLSGLIARSDTYSNRWHFLNLISFFLSSHFPFSCLADVVYLLDAVCDVRSLHQKISVPFSRPLHYILSTLIGLKSRCLHRVWEHQGRLYLQVQLFRRAHKRVEYVIWRQVVVIQALKKGVHNYITLPPEDVFQGTLQRSVARILHSVKRFQGMYMSGTKMARVLKTAANEMIRSQRFRIRPVLPRATIFSGALYIPTGVSSALLVLGNSRGTAKLRHRGLVVDALADSA